MKTPFRLLCIALCAGLMTHLASGATPSGPGIMRAKVDFESVATLAESVARRPYAPQVNAVPPALLGLSYDQYRDIRFKSSEALWWNDRLRFQVQFFHPGFLFNKTVRAHEFSPTHVQQIPFVTNFFDYGKLRIADQIPRDMGYAGFRVHSPMNSESVYDEVIVFLGASYFRAIGRDQHYGLSARGLAMNTAVGPEEFPVFTQFWLGKPMPGSNQMRMFALMESSSLAGAYEFVLTPGDETVVDVRAQLYFRDVSKQIGIAPLTSMFWFGEGAQTQGDWRPEVHDSDGLLIHNSAGEQLWRPLVNDGTVRRSIFTTEQVRGFGLLQRDRAFAHYEDLEARYENRPSAWIEPKGDWGPGKVWLYEFPTHREIDDNVVAFWEPATKPEPLKPFLREYRIRWMKNERLTPQPLGQVMATRLGNAFDTDKVRKFVIDFEADAADQKNGVSPVVETAGAKIVQGPVVQYNEVAKTWRLFFDIPLPERKDGAREPIELRAYLRNASGRCSEIWTYQWKP